VAAYLLAGWQVRRLVYQMFPSTSSGNLMMVEPVETPVADRPKRMKTLHLIEMLKNVKK